jgi:UDP:flavonoid glycosyltransferase YjiC (YdhE family)
VVEVGGVARRRVLFVGHDAGGTVPPVLALASALLDRGHEVVVLNQPSVRARAEAVGCRFVALSGVPDYDPGVALEEQLAVTVPVVSGRGPGDDVLSVARDEGADLVVVDANLAGALAAAEMLDRPSVVLLHSMYATFVRTWFADLWPLLGPIIDETRAGFGLPPAGSWAGLFSAHDRLLSVVPAELDAEVPDPPATLRHHGFLVPRPPAGEAPGFPSGDGPAVLVGLSTTYQQQEGLLERIRSALDEVGARAIVTSAGLPPVPHAAVLPQADAVVTHAGLGTVAAALAAGVPLVCTPIARDQPLNAERVAAVGAGVALPVDATAGSVAAALREVLGDPRYRAGAAAMAEASRRAGGAEAAAEDLESLMG